MSPRIRNLASVWALIAGVALAGAVSSSLSPQGRDRLAGLFGGDPRPGPALAVRTEQVPGTLANTEGAPMITGSTPDEGDTPIAFSSIAELSAEVARLRTKNRMLRIERDSLRGRLIASGPASAPETTASLPATGQPAGFQPPSAGISVRAMPMDGGLGQLPPATGSVPEDQIRRSLERALTADGNAIGSNRQSDWKPASQTHFAIDIGSGTSLQQIRERWQSFRRNHPDIAAGLFPAVSLMDGTDGTTRLHLLAGPLANAADAVALCTRLRNGGALCTTTVFDGQRLAQQ